MAKYALKRILLIIPTILLVMILAFFLSKAVPGDQAESLLTLQGITPENPNGAIEYKRNYYRLFLDKPNFYFSVLPDFYPENINNIARSAIRNQVRALLSHKLSFQRIEAFIEARDAFIINMHDSVKNEYVSRLKFTTDTIEMKNTISMIKNFTPTENNILFDKMNKAFESLLSSRSNIYYPVFHWHGSENQFHKWATQIASGNLGISLKDGVPAGSKIKTAMRWTILLLVLNLIFTCLIAIPIGLYSGYYPKGTFDTISSFFWLMIYSIPVFWLASLLIIYFTSDRYGSWMNIFPPTGSWIIEEGTSFFSQTLQFSGKLVLPLICLVANDISYLSRLTRNNVINQKKSLYTTMARAKGLSDKKVLYKHIFPNVLIPLVTIIAGSIPAGLSGSLIIEVIFNIPGMGRLMYDSIYASDWTVVFGVLIIISISTILFLLLSDMLYAYLHPKIRFDQR
ncbi:MAG: ABC transporter permease [Saprospiraceae bacterium]|nr:ABC transporter permease [Saprospiraceae bacterium]